MGEPNTASFLNRHGNALIIAATIVVIAAVVLWFADRQQARNAEAHRFDQQMDVLEQCPPPRGATMHSQPIPRDAEARFFEMGLTAMCAYVLLSL